MKTDSVVIKVNFSGPAKHGSHPDYRGNDQA